MRRLALLLTLIAVLPAAGGTAAAAPTVSVSVDDCRTAADPLQRYAIFRGEMDAVDRTDRMAMRFDLQVREPGDERFRSVDAPGLGTWIKSNPGTNGGFIWTKQVTQLVAPAEYRARVSFRWYDAGGRTIERASRRTKSCEQPDFRPDLELGALTAGAAPEPGLMRYRLPVRNTGRGDAGPFGVRFGDGDALFTITGLEAGASHAVEFLAPPCTRDDALRFEVDPDGWVAEADERDNVLRVACPADGRG